MVKCLLIVNVINIYLLIILSAIMLTNLYCYIYILILNVINIYLLIILLMFIYS